jgi:hypothetical protein
MAKAGRNDPCPCGSGKKFKKCCESKMLGGRFMAAKIDLASASQIRKTAGLASLFQARLAETPKKRLPPNSPLNSPEDGAKIASVKNPTIEINPEILLK